MRVIVSGLLWRHREGLSPILFISVVLSSQLLSPDAHPQTSNDKKKPTHNLDIRYNLSSSLGFPHIILTSYPRDITANLILRDRYAPPTPHRHPSPRRFLESNREYVATPRFSARKKKQKKKHIDTREQMRIPNVINIIPVGFNESDVRLFDV